MLDTDEEMFGVEVDVLKKQVHEPGPVTKRVTRLSALACNDYNKVDFDIDVAANQSQAELDVLGAVGCVQEMLAAQMLSVHRLQQLSIAQVMHADHPAIKQYFTNAAVKLANVFIQQASLLTKLQGGGQQKVTVEHVHVHDGGQAIVGNVNSNAGGGKG